MSSISPFTNSLNGSIFAYAIANAPATAATAPIIASAGAPIAPAIDPKILIKLPMLPIILPTINNTGANAATTMVPTAMIFFDSSFNSENHFENSFTLSTTTSITGASTSNKASPSAIITFFNSLNVFLNASDFVSNFPSASSVAPVEFLISSSVELKPCAPSPRSTSPAFAASALPHISPNASPCSFAPFDTISKASARLIPDCINSANDCPVFFFSKSETFVPDFPSSFNMEFIYVVDSAAATPLDVSLTYPVVI